MDSDMKEIDQRSIASDDPNAFRRIQSPTGGDEVWPNEDKIDGGLGVSLTRWLRSVLSEFHGLCSSEIRQEFFRLYKHWKRGLENQCGGLNTYDGVVPDNDVHLGKAPPEDLEEFKRQAHKALSKLVLGRQEFMQVTANDSTSESGRKACVQKLRSFCMVYMAVLEDLDKLDPETKER
ncbi:hypothetical protein COCNU_02G009510 [Cocos nucifera]|uniref:Uncharacterized protein n=1 Tax=Cocos nucifera TaxID=13894 RepID=A0A8K0HZ90_COCNU|nr:hypothetical protein COCNU_02G009510 [Cocos nucifera]